MGFRYRWAQSTMYFLGMFGYTSYMTSNEQQEQPMYELIRSPFTHFGRWVVVSTYTSREAAEADAATMNAAQDKYQYKVRKAK